MFYFLGYVRNEFSIFVLFISTMVPNSFIFFQISPLPKLLKKKNPFSTLPRKKNKENVFEIKIGLLVLGKFFFHLLV